MPFTQDKLADAVGLTPVHVSRTLEDLRQRDLLSFRSRRLTILDRARLEASRDFDATDLHLMGPGRPVP